MALVSDGISEDDARVIYSNAMTVNGMATYVGYIVGFIGGTYAFPSFGGGVKTPNPAVLDKYPSLRTLFGALDACSCRHCRSVLGPAAYLADLLHLLQTSPRDPKAGLPPPSTSRKALELTLDGTLLEALHARRPDIVDLELSCENTHTELPYIDLVLEILENAVALPATISPADAAGVDIAAEFAQGRVPRVIVDALAKTVSTVGKNPSAKRVPVQSGKASGGTDWVIKDGAHRWVVRYQPHTLGGRAMAALDEAVAAFQRLQVSACVVAVLQDSQVPLIGTPAVSAAAPETGPWVVTCTYGVGLSFDHVQGRVVVCNIDTNAEISSQPVPSASVAHVADLLGPPGALDASGSISGLGIIFTKGHRGSRRVRVEVMSAGSGCQIIYEESKDNINWKALWETDRVGAQDVLTQSRYFRARCSVYGSGVVSVRAAFIPDSTGPPPLPALTDPNTIVRLGLQRLAASLWKGSRSQNWNDAQNRWELRVSKQYTFTEVKEMAGGGP